MRRIALALLALTSVALLVVFAAATTRSGIADSSVSLSPTPPVRPVTWEVDVSPNAPAPGGDITLTVTADVDKGPWHGKDAVYELVLEETSPLTLSSPAVVTRPELGEPVAWTLSSESPGPASVKLSLQYILTYYITGTPPGAYTAFAGSPYIDIDVGSVAGDVDCGSTVNAIDAALVLQLDAALLSSLPCEPSADLNADGEIDAADAAIILQAVAGLIDASS